MSARSNVLYKKIASGLVVPFPLKSFRPINHKNVVYHGESALNIYFDDDSRNEALLAYKSIRASLSCNFFGKWVAISASKNLIIGDSEQIVARGAPQVFGPDFYHIDAIGCEYLEHILMDGNTSDLSDSQDSYPEFDGTSAVFENQFLVKVDYAWNGSNTFKNTIMKHDTGATMVGVPMNILSNPPEEVIPIRGKDEIVLSTPHSFKRARVYEDWKFRVADLTITTSVIEARTWLLGFPILAHFVSTTDITSQNPVQLQPVQI